MPSRTRGICTGARCIWPCPASRARASAPTNNTGSIGNAVPRRVGRRADRPELSHTFTFTCIRYKDFAAVRPTG
eukprot:scaffold19092_cov90-Isochrysis_galbana.AAC.4